MSITAALPGFTMFILTFPGSRTDYKYKGTMSCEELRARLTGASSIEDLESLARSTLPMSTAEDLENLARSALPMSTTTRDEVAGSISHL